jgi:hypothetical protein
LRRAESRTTILAGARLPWGRPHSEGTLSLSDLADPPPRGQVGPPPAPLVWIEEGTDWADGLPYILAAAAEQVLAFPETRAAAARDRRLAQPITLALSSAHHRKLQADLAAHLPTGYGPTARIVRAALAGERSGPLQRWLLHWLRRPLGLAQVRAITVVGVDRTALDRAGIFAALGLAASHVSPPYSAAPIALAFA